MFRPAGPLEDHRSRVAWRAYREEGEHHRRPLLEMSVFFISLRWFVQREIIGV